MIRFKRQLEVVIGTYGQGTESQLRAFKRYYGLLAFYSSRPYLDTLLSFS